MAEYKLDNGTFVVSSGDIWRPGIYENKRAAKYAGRFTDEEINSMHKIERPAERNEPLTFDVMQKYRSQKPRSFEPFKKITPVDN